MEHSVVFIPWFEGEGARTDLTFNAEQWRKEATHKVFTITYPDDDFPLYVPKKSESIYIMGGHCEPKLDNVYWSPPKEKTARLYAKEYVERFNMLFPTDIECRVLVYSCYSAVDGKEAFGRRVAAAMRTLGYKKCQIWGYTSPVAQKYYGGPKEVELASKAFKKGFPKDIDDEHPHRYAKKVGGHPFFATWQRGSDTLEKLDDVV